MLAPYLLEEAGAFAASLVEVLKRGGQTIALAESCTGGLIGDLLTDVEGSSSVFVGRYSGLFQSRKARQAWGFGGDAGQGRGGERGYRHRNVPGGSKRL